MVCFFQSSPSHFFAIGIHRPLNEQDQKKLKWLFSGAELKQESKIDGSFIGPRKEMITPWSTNAVEICQNAGISGIYRIEEYITNEGQLFDPMLQQKYEGLNDALFTLDVQPVPIKEVKDLSAFNESEGLALSQEEIDFLKDVSAEIGRPLTDSEVFGFSQINSEHCRHKIFNGTFIIDGNRKETSLFQLIKSTSQTHSNKIISAYKDNVAFVAGPVIEQFAPKTQDKPDYFESKEVESVISLKAETHNFPTTVEPFNGAATGSGGEIRDRMAGGQGSFPLAGTAVYMTSYPRLEPGRSWEEKVKEREWLYQTPKEILIKASNGASDFGNKFGQPLIAGSVLTFEHEENGEVLGFDKVIMLAGGIGYAKLSDSLKKKVEANESIIVLGGDNYRIGMGGSAVSSVDTGAYGQNLELNAVQRSNPEMQKRVANAVRAMAEMDENPIVSIHDHGAGGHLNCLSELVEETGGIFDLDKFPIGDPTLSDKEIIGNESQERMGLVMKSKDAQILRKVSERERAPYYEVGKTSNNDELKFSSEKRQTKPFELKLNHLFGASPKTLLEDQTSQRTFQELKVSEGIFDDLKKVLSLEAVACKDWLTNKVDRSVTGKVAMQQTVGEIQLPLNNLGVMALDYLGVKGAATSIGHSPVPALIDSGVGSRLSVAESLTNLVWAPLTHGLKGVSLSANWMWPAKNKGENARLYKAVEEISEFVKDLGINIPTGKDSLSMTQKYQDQKVQAPGTVIISAVGEVSDINKVISPALKPTDSTLYYIDFSGSEFDLGGSSYAQTQGSIGIKAPDIEALDLKNAFDAVQELVNKGLVLAGHDVSAGGLVTTLLEMTFPNESGGMNIDLREFEEADPARLLFSEKPAIVIQVSSSEQVEKVLKEHQVSFTPIGKTSKERLVTIQLKFTHLHLPIDELRDTWYRTSHLFDLEQTERKLADLRAANYKTQPLRFDFHQHFIGTYQSLGINPKRRHKTGHKAAIIREKGVNGDREMAYALHLAGFDVKDVHMTDLASGRDDLSDVNMIVFVGGFSNSDVLGSAKGWAGSFLFNEKAKRALDNFYSRKDTLSLGVCNGCQLMMELGLVMPELGENHPKMKHNSSGKFESAFIDVVIQENETVMLKSMAGARLGIWLAHGEGRFELPQKESDYVIPVKYAYDEFPGNPNGSKFATAAMASKDGRHVAIMPHLERSLFPWNWPHYPEEANHEVSPWIEPFVNARKWVENQ